MRGKVRLCSFDHYASGITPAHAGKSGRCAARTVAVWDHPRPCGEKAKRVVWAYATRGSPPPMRGKAAQNGASRRTCRITPAHAGKRRHSRFCINVIQDHPRPCGEKFIFMHIFLPNQGSPPPMRGKAGAQVVSELTARITPAHAGKSTVSLPFY